MIEVNKQETCIITMSLSKEEAQWLKAVMQNAFEHSAEAFTNESHSDNAMRRKFFDAMDNALSS